MSTFYKYRKLDDTRKNIHAGGSSVSVFYTSLSQIDPDVNMIRKATSSDIDRMADIWLKASIIAHNFISPSFWEDNLEKMKTVYLPGGSNYVYQDPGTGEVLGFISLAGDYIAALFVDPSHQQKGIGRELMDYVKGKHSSLSLSVYAENAGSVAFYTKQGFVITEERIEEQTGHTECVMSYTSE